MNIQLLWPWEQLQSSLSMVRYKWKTALTVYDHGVSFPKSAFNHFSRMFYWDNADLFPNRPELLNWCAHCRWKLCGKVQMWHGATWAPLGLKWVKSSSGSTTQGGTGANNMTRGVSNWRKGFTLLITSKDCHCMASEVQECWIDLRVNLATCGYGNRPILTPLMYGYFSVDI